MTEENFDGESAALLFAGNALHADLTPETSGSALFGWMLVGLGARVRVPGAGRRSRRDHGRPGPASMRGVSRSSATRPCRVYNVTERSGVRGHHGRWKPRPQSRRAGRLRCRHVDAQMVGLDALPGRYLARHQTGSNAPPARSRSTGRCRARCHGLTRTSHGAGTVHVADSLDELTMTSAQLAMSQVPDKPFLLVGQMTTVRPDSIAGRTPSRCGRTPTCRNTRRATPVTRVTRSMGQRPRSTGSPIAWSDASKRWRRDSVSNRRTSRDEPT